MGPPKGRDEFESEARLLLALKLYETGKLTSGLAAKLAGIPRVAFLFLLGQHGLSPFGEEPDELERDLDHAAGPVVLNNTPLVALWAVGRLDLPQALDGLRPTLVAGTAAARSATTAYLGGVVTGTLCAQGFAGT